MRAPAPLLGLLLLAACEDEGPGLLPPDGGLALDAGATHDGGMSSDAGALRDAGSPRADASSPFDAGSNSGPLLERPNPQRMHCQVSTPVTALDPLLWRTDRALWTASSGAVYFARAESDGTTEPELKVSTLSRSGLGSALSLAGLLGAGAAFPSGALTPTGFALTWLEGQDLRLASFDGRGVPSTAPKSLLPRPLAGLESARLAAGQTGLGVVMVARPAQDQPAELHFLTADETGTTRSGPELFSTMSGPYGQVTPAVVSTGAGFVVAWVDPTAATARLHLAALAPDARPLGPIVEIENLPGHDAARGFGFAPVEVGLVALGSEVFVAWAEMAEGAPGQAPSRSVIRLLKLTERADPASPPYALEAPSDDVDHVEPDLTVLGGLLSLTWASGGHIYICGGCVPDHSLRQVLLDPLDLTPVSLPVTLDDAERGGLLGRDVAVSGGELLMSLGIQLHVSARPAYAAIACTD